MTKHRTATRTRWTALAAFALIALVVMTVLRAGSTAASFTDQVTSANNTLSTASLQAPTLAASVSGTTVSLSWNNPDSLSGASASFVLERAAGACTAPGTFAAVAGSPFAITTLSTTNVPGTGTFCYRIQSQLNNWTSPVGTSASVNWEAATVAPVTPVIQSLKFDSEASGDTCGPSRIEAGTVSGTVTIVKDSSRTWVDDVDALTLLPSGGYNVTLARVQHSVNADDTKTTSFTVEIGTCSGGAFSVKGSATGAFGNPNESVTVPINLDSSTTLSSSTLLAVRVTNTFTGADPQVYRTIKLATDGNSVLVGPSSFKP